jgi:hypothetical protein
VTIAAPGLSPQAGRAPDWRPVRKAAVASFPFFIEHIIRDFYGRELAINSRYGFHRDMAGFISRPRSERKDVALVMAPRGYLKSTICTNLHSLWSLLVDPDETIMIMHGVERMAQSYFEEIERIIFRCGWLRWIAKDIFGADPAKDLESKDYTLRVNCRRGDKVPSLSCYGMNSATAGHHYSLYKLDDLVNDSNYDTPEGIEKPIKKFCAVMNTMRGTRSRVDVMDTVYANDDLTQFLQDPKGQWSTSIDVFHRRWYVESNVAWGPRRLKPDGTEFAPGEESWWPEVKPREWIEGRKRIGPVAFAQQFLCEPAVDGARLFRKEWLPRYPLSVDEHDNVVLPGSEWDESGAERRTWRIDMALDGVAKEKASQSKDVACILVGARNDEGELYLLDVFYQRPNEEDWYETVHRFFCKWRPKRMPMEDVGVSAVLYRALEQDGKRRGVKYPLYPSRRDGSGVSASSKLKRAQALQGFLQRGECKIPEGELWEGPIRELVSYQYGIKEQRDDFLDCLFDLWDLPTPPSPSRVAATEAAWSSGVAWHPRMRRWGSKREVAR